MASSRNGFGDAFELGMGMSLQDYEENFFELVFDFLDRPASGTYIAGGGAAASH